MWLHLPCAVLPSAPERPALSSRSTSPSQAIAPSAMSSASPRPSRSSRRASPMAHSTTRRSGTTFAPSTAARGVARWISSLRDTPASLSPTRARCAASRTRGTSGRRSRASSARCGRNGSSSKTCKTTSASALPWSATTYDAWATALTRDCSRRLKSARAIRGEGFWYWPTPTRSATACRTDLIIAEKGLFFDASLDQKGTQESTGRAAHVWTAAWELIAALGWKGPLPQMVSPSSRRLRVSLRLGDGASYSILVYNPRFGEWLMGWPGGWTDTRSPVTGWCRWLRRMRTELSRLGSATRTDGLHCQLAISNR